MSGGAFPAIDESNFETEVTARKGLVLLDFWNEGCVPCRQLSRVLTELSPSLPAGVRIATINAAENPALVRRFDVRSVPTLVFLRDGTVVDTRTGVDRKQVIRKIVDAHT